MGEKTNIAWTNKTFNAWEGCTKVSPGCDHCYAEVRDQRFHKGIHWGPHADRKLTKTWGNPVKWNKEAERLGIRYKVFCASLADVFDNHKSILPEWRADLWKLIKATPHLDWQLLTKRPQNIEKFLPDDWGPENYSHVWLGTSAETQEELNRRAKHILRNYAAHHFLSIEPLLGSIDLTRVKWSDVEGMETANILTGQIGGYIKSNLHCLNTIDWVIIGGESGPNARTFDMFEAHKIINQCVQSGTKVFMKQFGENPISPSGHPWPLRSKKGENLDEWPTPFKIQQFPGDK